MNFPVLLISFIFGFMVGGIYCMHLWNEATKRGRYELGGKIWKVEEIIS